MSDCERFETTIQAYVAGELDDRDLGPLLLHCRACEACRHVLELHRDLAALAARTPEPDEADFDALQARVLGQVGARRRTRTEAPGGRRSDGWRLVAGSPLRAAAAMLAAASIFLAWLAIGRIEPGRSAGSGNGAFPPRLVHAISADAASNRELTDVEDSRFTYSNVSFRRVDRQRVALEFDVSTHVRLVEPVQSELVQEVLVHSLLNPSNTGARLKAMSYAAGVMEPKVREALIFAMSRDENLAVRLQALTVLSDQLDQPEVESAVLAILRDDDSVQMRLLALDFLAEHSVDRASIRQVLRESERPDNEALTVRLAEYEERL